MGRMGEVALPFERGGRTRLPILSNGEDEQGYPFFRTERTGDIALPSFQMGRIGEASIRFE